MFLVDTEEGRIVVDNEVKGKIARQKPYRRWLEQNLIELRGLFQPSRPLVRPTTKRSGPAAAGVRLYARRTATDPGPDGTRRALKPVGSMGTDTPLAVLSNKSQTAVQLLQAALRPGHQPAHRPASGKDMVMSTETAIGSERNLLRPSRRNTPG
jgi:hypothetical protein